MGWSAPWLTVFAVMLVLPLVYGVRTQPSAGVLQYNGRLPYTADNGCRLGADNHMPVWNVPFQPKGDAEQR